MTLRLALVGLGQIARSQHLPSIAATDGVELAAIASRGASLPDLPCWTTIDALLADKPAIDAVSLCTPPLGRFDQVRAALGAGKHVMMEKPPGMTVSEVQVLARMAVDRSLTLFATWHSRFAAAVEPFRTVLAQRSIRSVRIVWKEDVRVWHPGQEWIWEPGGLGVFDPGINALSILTRVLPEPVFLEQSDLFFPSNRAAPIAANLRFRSSSGVPVTAEFDWRQTGPQSWDIFVETAEGPVAVSHGGSRLYVDGDTRIEESDQEYRNLYERFVNLVTNGESDVDLSPLQQVADAFMIGRRHVVEAFES